MPKDIALTSSNQVGEIVDLFGPLMVGINGTVFLHVWDRAALPDLLQEYGYLGAFPLPLREYPLPVPTASFNTSPPVIFMAWCWLLEPGWKLPNEAIELVMEYSAPTRPDDPGSMPTAPNYRPRLVGILSSGISSEVISSTSIRARTAGKSKQPSGRDNKKHFGAQGLEFGV